MSTTNQLATIDLRINGSNQQIFKALGEYVNTGKNTPSDQGTSAVNFSSGPSVTPMNPYLNQSLHIVWSAQICLDGSPNYFSQGKSLYFVLLLNPYGVDIILTILGR